MMVHFPIVVISGMSLPITGPGTGRSGMGHPSFPGRRILSDEREGDPRFNLTVIVKQP